MTDLRRTAVDWDSGPEPLPIEIIARTIDPKDSPRECTLYPSVVEEDAVTTTWITAKEGSFVSIEQAR